VSRSRSKRSSSKPSKTARLKAIPWAALMQVGWAAGERWRALSPKDRARLSQLVRTSRGRIGRLSSREREELRKLVGKLDLRGMGRELVPLMRGRRRRKRR